MERAEIVKQVAFIIAEQLAKKEDEIKEEQKLVADLGFDELDAIEVQFAIEEVFNIELTDEIAEKMETVKDLVDFVEKNIVKVEPTKEVK